MSDYIDPNLEQLALARTIGRISFFTALGGALILLISAFAVNLTVAGISQRVLSWLAILGLVAMLGGIVVYVIHIIFVLIQNRNANAKGSPDG